MMLFLICLLGLSCGALIILIFGLLGAGKRADEGEEKILKIISPAPLAERTGLSKGDFALMG